jgi:MFS transporter, PAT family, beta-lactamase induction signal transducer AmpG
MAGLVPATHEHPCNKEIMGPRHKAGDDEAWKNIPRTLHRPPLACSVDIGAPIMAERVLPGARLRPVFYIMLFLPMGITNGYAVVSLAYLLSQAGVSVGAIAALVGLSLLPQTWRAIWAPLVDATLSVRAWYLISAVASGLLMAATAFIPITRGNLGIFEALCFGFSFTATITTIAGSSLMAHGTSEEEKGRAGGWSQAGNLGGTGLGGGLGLWLAQHAPLWTSGTALGVFCIATSLALLFLKEPAAEHRVPSLFGSLANVGRDCWTLLTSHRGALVFFLMLLPIGVGAAQNLWSAVANDWHASADAVALVNGVLGGVVAMVGCLIGGWICDLIDRKTAYNLFGLVIAAAAVAMALSPRTQTMFVFFVLLYAFLTGFCYAAFAAVVFETIGKGAAGTKANILSGISNVPLIYAGIFDGSAHDRWDSNGLLYTDAALSVVGVLVFVAVAFVVRMLASRTPVSA